VLATPTEETLISDGVRLFVVSKEVAVGLIVDAVLMAFVAISVDFAEPTVDEVTLIPARTNSVLPPPPSSKSTVFGSGVSCVPISTVTSFGSGFS
jgi:hypothetical protein